MSSDVAGKSIIRRVLIVDDQPEIVEGLRNILMSHYEVDTARSAAEAIRRCAASPYDCAVIDVNLGAGVSGLELARSLRHRYQRIHLVVVSAIEYSDAVRQAVVDLGGVFEEKPIDLKRTRRAIEGSS